MVCTLFALFGFGVEWSTHMMTSANGTFATVLALCDEKSTGHRWFPRTKTSDGDAELWCFLWCAWTKGWGNSPDSGDLRRNGAHCDVIIMIIQDSVTGSVAFLWIQPWRIWVNIHDKFSKLYIYLDIFLYITTTKQRTTKPRGTRLKNMSKPWQSRHDISGPYLRNAPIPQSKRLNDLPMYLRITTLDCLNANNITLSNMDQPRKCCQQCMHDISGRCLRNASIPRSQASVIINTGSHGEAR